MNKDYNTIKKQLDYLFNDSYLDDENTISRLKKLQGILNSFLISSILDSNLNKDELIEKMRKEIDEKINEYEKEKQRIIDNQNIFFKTNVYCGSKSLDIIDKKIEMAKRLKESLNSGLYDIIKNKYTGSYEDKNELKLACFKELFKNNKSITISDRSLGYLYTDILHINKEILENIEIIISDKKLSDELKQLFRIYNDENSIKEEIEQIKLIIENYNLLSTRLSLTMENQIIDSRIMSITSNKIDVSRKKISKLSSNKITKRINNYRIKKLTDDIEKYSRIAEKLYRKRMNNLSCVNKIEAFLKRKGLILDFHYNALYSVKRYKYLLEDKQTEFDTIHNNYIEYFNLLDSKTKKLLESDFIFAKDVTNYILLDQNNCFKFYILYILENIEDIIAQEMQENDNYKSSELMSEVEKEFLQTYKERLSEIDNYELKSKTKKLTCEN